MHDSNSIEDDLMKLPSGERAALILRVWENLVMDPALSSDPTFDPEGIALAERREQNIDSGDIATISMAEFKRRTQAE
jgi:hypothetical protein